MRKVEIHVFPDKTSGSKSFKVSFAGTVIAVLCVVLAIIGFFIFAPSKISDNISDGNVMAVYRQNKIIKKEIKGIRASVDESILKAEENRILRDSTLNLGGLGFTLEENSGKALEAPRKSLSEIEDTFRSLLSKLEADSSIAANLPITHPFKNGHAVKNRFEMIYDPFTEQELPHRGIDYVAQVGDTVVATGGGVINEIRNHRGFGLTIKLDHKPGVRTFYAHLGKALVQDGARVKRGQPIALIGESGTESSVSLHYEIRVNGVPVNPEDYFITK